MRIPLAEPQTRGDFKARLQHKLPALLERLEWLERTSPDLPDDDELVGEVLAIRSRAQAFIQTHAEIAAEHLLELDCRHVAVMSPSFADEILKAWPTATFINANEDVAETVAMVRQRREIDGG